MVPSFLLAAGEQHTATGGRCGLSSVVLSHGFPFCNLVLLSQVLLSHLVPDFSGEVLVLGQRSVLGERRQAAPSAGCSHTLSWLSKGRHGASGPVLEGDTQLISRKHFDLVIAFHEM